MSMAPVVHAHAPSDGVDGGQLQSLTASAVAPRSHSSLLSSRTDMTHDGFRQANIDRVKELAKGVAIRLSAAAGAGASLAASFPLQLPQPFVSEFANECEAEEDEADIAAARATALDDVQQDSEPEQQVQDEAMEAVHSASCIRAPTPMDQQ